jgi:hypothetical protein
MEPVKTSGTSASFDVVGGCAPSDKGLPYVSTRWDRACGRFAVGIAAVFKFSPHATALAVETAIGRLTCTRP